MTVAMSEPSPPGEAQVYAGDEQVTIRPATSDRECYLRHPETPDPAWDAVEEWMDAR